MNELLIHMNGPLMDIDEKNYFVRTK